MSEPPRVSIVIPMFNSSRYLRAAVDSVLGQTMPDLELVLHDDGSTDETLEIADRYAANDERVRVVRGAHAGIAAARNGGFARTDRRSPYVTFLDHDDVWEPHALATLSSALDADDRRPAAHGVARCIGPDGRPIPGDDHAQRTRDRKALVDGRIQDLDPEAPTSFAALLVAHYVTTPGNSLIRREAFEAVGGFEARTVPCDDWDLNLRISRLGGFAFVDDIILNWRRHDLATSNLDPGWRRAYLLTRERTIDDPANTSSERREAKAAVRAEMMEMPGAAWAELRRGAVRQAAKRAARAALLALVLLGVRRHHRR